MDDIDLLIYGHIGFDIIEQDGVANKVPGGAAFYACYGATVSGSRIGLVSVIGSDFAESEFAPLSLNSRGLIFRDGQSARFWQGTTQQNAAQILEGRLSVDLGVCEGLKPELIPLDFLNAKFALICTAPPQQQAEVLRWLRLHNFHGRIAVDSIGEYIEEFSGLILEWGTSLNYIFLNQEEFGRLSSLPDNKITLIVKCGAAGAMIRTAGIWVTHDAPRVNSIVSAVGAGDILAGLFLGKVALGHDANTALIAGIRVASESVTRMGVGHVLHPSP